MPNREVHLSEDVSAAQWIGPKLEGPFGTVTRTVPAGYPAYARVCHPAEDGEGGLGSAQVIPPAFPAELMNVPRVRHPGRDYFLFTGPLTAASHFGWQPRPDDFEPQSPNIFWPSDRAWCVATEIDFDSTLVGGTTELINAILTEPALDAWPVNSHDSLAADADHINLVR